MADERPHAELQGADYRAVHRLANGDDDVTYAAIGETCERVPVESLPGLLASGYIAPAATAAARQALDESVDEPDGEVA